MIVLIARIVEAAPPESSALWIGPIDGLIRRSRELSARFLSRPVSSLEALWSFAWAELSNAHDFHTDALAALEPSRAEELRALFATKSEADVTALVAAVPLDSAVRFVLGAPSGFLEGSVPQRLRALVELSRGLAPPLLWMISASEKISSEPADRTAELIAHLWECEPSVPIGLATTPDQLEVRLGALPSRTAAMLRSRRRVLPEPSRLTPATEQSVTRLAETIAGADVDFIETIDAIAERAPDRARSAAERFLFRQLERMPATRGLFALNSRQRIGARTLELDLFAASLGLAIEIDGYFHFTDAEAYRRDRRKDVELQQRGLWVLRFLSEDVVARLEDILAQIEHAIARRRSGETRWNDSSC